MEPARTLTIEPIRYTAHAVYIDTAEAKEYLKANPPPAYTRQESTRYAWLISIDGTIVAGCRHDGQPLLTESGCVFFNGHSANSVGNGGPRNIDEMDIVRSLIADSQCRCVSFQTALQYPEEVELMIQLRLPHPVYEQYKKDHPDLE